jgi:broad specificity phosphatase PhoE
MPQPTTVWLARHGEVHNPAGLLYGRLPRMRLTPEGRRQASALARLLAERPLAAIYSSPMLRARHTAHTVLSSHPRIRRVRIDSDLHEVRTGWQGQPIEALERIDWNFYAHPAAPMMSRSRRFTLACGAGWVACYADMRVQRSWPSATAIRS